jgi:Domain of unknown function (DUF4342)
VTDGCRTASNLSPRIFVACKWGKTMADQTWWEKVEAKGGALLDRLKQLIAEGNVRRVRVRQKDHVVAEFPLTIGVVGAVLAPVVAAIGAVTALLTDCTIEVERQNTDGGAPPAA